MYTAQFRAKAPPPQAADAQYFCMGHDDDAPAAWRPAPLTEVRPQDKEERHCGSGFELVLDVTVPQMGGELVVVPNVVSQVVEQNVYIPVHGGSAPVVESISHAPPVFSLVVEYISPASAVLPAPSPVEEYIAPAPAVFQASSPVVEYIAPTPAVLHAPVPSVESLAPAPALSESPAPGGYFSPVPAVFLAPAPVVEYFSPAPAVSHAAHCRGLQGSVSGHSSTSRRRHVLPLPSGWRREEGAYGRVYFWHVHTRQTRFTLPVSDVED